MTKELLTRFNDYLEARKTRSRVNTLIGEASCIYCEDSEGTDARLSEASELIEKLRSAGRKVSHFEDKIHLLEFQMDNYFVLGSHVSAI